MDICHSSYADVTKVLPFYFAETLCNKAIMGSKNKSLPLVSGLITITYTVLANFVPLQKNRSKWYKASHQLK